MSKKIDELPPLDEEKIKNLSAKFKAKKEAEKKSSDAEKSPGKLASKVPIKERMKKWWFKPEKKEEPEKKKETSKNKSEDKSKDKPEEIELPKIPKEKKGFFKKEKTPEKKEEYQAPAETIQKKDPKAEAKAKKEAEEQEKKVRKSKQKKKPRNKLKRKSLEQYLEKAGFSVSATKVKRVIFYSTIVLFLLLTAVVLYQAASWGEVDAPRFLLFIFALWTVLFAGALLFGQAVIYFYLDYRVYKRTVQVEDVLPDFLQLASSNIAAGMPVDRALWYSIRPQFGVLAKEMEEVAKATMAGEDLETSLMNFTEKYDSKLLKRSITILIEGLNAGGEMADLLNKIALNIDELKIMKKEMAASVTTYAIFITFAAVVIAPFLFALATELLNIIIKITGNLDIGSTGGLFSFTAADPDIVGNFTIFSILMLIVTAGFSTSIVSIIRKGNVIEGIKEIPFYAAISVAIYYGSVVLLHGMFGGII